MTTTDERLAEVLARHEFTLPFDQIAGLERYCSALWAWNEKLNLTRHMDYEKFVTRDLKDTLVLADVLQPKERVLDVGTGGGVPGAVLAIVRPDLKVALCDSVAKKAKAVGQIVTEAGIRATVHHARAEELLERERFDTLAVRAVAPLTKLLTWFAPHWNSFGRLLVIKGPAWVEERHEAREKGQMKNLTLRKLASYPLPGTHSESVLLSISPKD